MTKVLVAEDDGFLSKAYLAKLSKAGLDVQAVQDGEEVMKTLETFGPDILILDLIMPGKDGFAVLQEMKTSETWKNLPVLIASNLGQKEDIDKGLELGANDYIIKSDLSMTELVEKIKKLTS